MKYRPRGEHVGLEVRAKVLGPKGARAAAVTRRKDPSALREEIQRAVTLLTSDGSTTRSQLSQHVGDPKGVYSAEVVVSGQLGEPLAAKVRFEIWALGHPRRIASRVLRISAIG